MKKYAVIFERASTGWSAYVPDLPGLVAAARSFAKIEQLIREGVEFHIEGLRAHGEPVPAPSTRAIEIAIPALERFS